jgi:L-rhamnonate dehydratase
MQIESANIETRLVRWDGPGWPFESRNANPMDAYEDSARHDPQPPAPGAGPAERSHLFVRIRAGGLTARYGPIESYAAGVAERLICPWLIGKDATRIVELNDRMQRLNRHARAGLFMTAVAAVDLCLWQLRGQAEDRPAYRMLGGPTRADVPAYASMLGFAVEPARAAERAREYAAAGYAAQKWFFRFGPRHGAEGLRANVALARAVRGAVGDEYPLMFDAFNGWDGAYAADVCRRLEEFRPAWLEEPIPPEDLEGWKRLRAATRVPLATGEHVHARRQALTLLAAGVVDVLQCDPDWAGGLTEMQAIIHLASAYGVPVIPHGHTLLPALHLALAHPPDAMPMVEHLINIQPERHALYKVPPVPDRGRFAPPRGVGLGVEIRESE